MVFATVDNEKLQLASAGADQTIKLIDVEDALRLKVRKTLLR
jgi:hypothetical protein